MVLRRPILRTDHPRRDSSRLKDTHHPTTTTNHTPPGLSGSPLTSTPVRAILPRTPDRGSGATPTTTDLPNDDTGRPVDHPTEPVRDRHGGTDRGIVS